MSPRSKRNSSPHNRRDTSPRSRRHDHQRTRPDRSPRERDRPKRRSRSKSPSLPNFRDRRRYPRPRAPSPPDRDDRTLKTRSSVNQLDTHQNKTTKHESDVNVKSAAAARATNRWSSPESESDKRDSKVKQKTSPDRPKKVVQLARKLEPLKPQINDGNDVHESMVNTAATTSVHKTLKRTATRTSNSPAAAPSDAKKKYTSDVSDAPRTVSVRRTSEGRSSSSKENSQTIPPRLVNSYLIYSNLENSYHDN